VRGGHLRFDKEESLVSIKFSLSLFFMRAGKFSYLFFISLLLIIVVSCSIQKRNYRQGYHVEWKNKNPPDLSLSKYTSVKHHTEPTSLAMQLSLKENLAQSATSSLQKEITKRVVIKQNIVVDNCDTIIFKSGRKVIAKVLEINPSEIKYKSCNNPDPTVNTIDKNEIRYIIYANGTKEFFSEVNKEPSTNNYTKNGKSYEEYEIKELADDSFTAGICGLIGLIVIFPVGLIACFLAIRRGKKALAYMENDPILKAKYGKKARAGLTMGRIGCFLPLVIIAAIIIVTVLKI
jgi:hypothetical protein